MFLRWTLALIIGLVLGWQQTWAAITPDSKTILSQVRVLIAERYPGARIETGERITWVRGTSPQNPGTVRLIEETPRGEIRVSVEDSLSGELSEATLSFAAWSRVWISKKRVFPGERLVSDNFVLQSVNVAAPAVRDFRGMILSAAQSVESLEARQTILEGQFVLSTAVQKVPDVRRGDPITLKLRSEGLVVSTQGVAEEPAYLNGRVRVLSTKTKRSLTGLLVERGVVEVEL